MPTKWYDPTQKTNEILYVLPILLLVFQDWPIAFKLSSKSEGYRLDKLNRINTQLSKMNSLSYPSSSTNAFARMYPRSESVVGFRGKANPARLGILILNSLQCLRRLGLRTSHVRRRYRGFSIITNTSSIFCVWTRLAKTSYCFCYLYYLILFQTKKTHCTNVSQLLYHYHSTITMQYTSFSNFLFYVDSGWLTQADWLWLTNRQYWHKIRQTDSRMTDCHQEDYHLGRIITIYCDNSYHIYFITYYF